MNCWNSADLCAVRFSLLDADGSPLHDEVDGTAYDMTPISLQVTPTVDAGETVTTRTGCGDVCYTRTDADVNTGADLVLTICTFDVELIALVTGSEAYMGPNGGPAMAVGVQTPDAVESHFWTKTKDGSADVASPNNYWHHVYPNVQWSLGSFTKGRDVLQMVLNGTAQVSASIGDGGFNDIPTDPVDPYWWNVWTADDIPDPDVAPYNENGFVCGFITTPADDSPTSP